MSEFFVLWATDKPGGLARRQQLRPRHRAYLDAPGRHAVKVLQGGPTLDPRGNDMNGTLLIIEANSREDVEAFAADDPYARAGLFEHVEIRPWLWTRGRTKEGERDA
ncbi:YciI family protein [Halomonas sp. H5]|uniref:YciI family protein n=1 Tax=Halomonas sp. H5 TaxID=3423910 RepID=UPI003D364D9A